MLSHGYIPLQRLSEIVTKNLHKICLLNFPPNQAPAHNVFFYSNPKLIGVRIPEGRYQVIRR